MVKLVGILNVTPDSFSDGGQFIKPQAAIKQASLLFEQGAAWIDVGAESTRPNATALSDDEEWDRLKSILPELLRVYPGKISLDTYHPETVRRAFDVGPVIVNDVTGFNNPEMVRVVSGLLPKVIISHLPSQDIQEAHRQEPISDVRQVREDLLAKAELLQSKGLSRSQIILDPGIGFGKSAELNGELLKFAEEVPDYDVMVGYSRKRFLGEHRMNIQPNIEAGKIAIAHGAKYLRVHDVAAHTQLIS